MQIPVKTAKSLFAILQATKQQRIYEGFGFIEIGREEDEMIMELLL